MNEKSSANLHVVFFPSHKEIPSMDYGYTSSGVLGEHTNSKDCNDEDIHIGDVLKVTKSNGRWFTGIVILHHDHVKEETYYSVRGMCGKSIQELVNTYKVEKCVSYTYLNQEYRRYINHIILHEKYLEDCFDLIDGEWKRIKY